MSDCRIELVFTRRFCMGHRLITGTSEKCAIPHGHNEYVTVILGPGSHNPKSMQLDGQENMLLPFAEAKGRWHDFIDNALDHSLQLSQHDPLLEWFLTSEPQRIKRILVTPGDPTTELLAALLMCKLNAFLKAQGNKLAALSLEIQETPTNTVRLHGDPKNYLPPMPLKDEDYWWHRPDNSISNFTS